MKSLSRFWRENANVLIWVLLVLAGLAFLMLYRLGSLVGGMSHAEILTIGSPVGWHGIFHHPLDLPLKLARSIIFYLSPGHGQTLSRLPNVIFGSLAVLNFAWLIWLWHGYRTAVLATLLFATSAWTLHVSRFASSDVIYLWAITTLLLIQVLLHKFGGLKVVWYASLLLWGLMLYVPGMIWLMVIQVVTQRRSIAKAWSTERSIRKLLLSVAAIVIWLPLLIFDFTRHGEFIAWLGLPSHFPSAAQLFKQFVGVFVHLFIRGPQYPELWLARAPVLDVLTLVVVCFGIYFYAKNWRASRTRSLGAFVGSSVILVGLGGAVSLSLPIALLYVIAAAGIASLLHDWLKVFPLNPLARSFGIGLVALAVALSCTYNLRAYFVAWPHNTISRASFRYHR